jgi:hypothetical protein
MSRAVGERGREDVNGDDRDSVLAPLVIDVIPEQTRAELEASIDAPLVVERFERHKESDRHATTDSTGDYYD